LCQIKIDGLQIWTQNEKWTQILKIDSIERIRVFIWQLAHNRLMTKARLAKWDIGNPICHICYQFEETTMHVVRDCKVAVHVWRHLLTNQEHGKKFYGGISRVDEAQSLQRMWTEAW
jgi:hypothetical protein